MEFTTKFTIKEFDWWNYSIIDVIDFAAGITKGEFRLKGTEYYNKRKLNQKQNLVKRLMTESGGEPSSVFEFIYVDYKYEKYKNFFNDLRNSYILNYFFKYSIVDVDSMSFSTNLRNIINMAESIALDEVKVSEELNGFLMLWTGIAASLYMDNNVVGNSAIKDMVKGDFKNYFRIIYGEVPYKFITHITRHRKFSFLVETSRSKKYNPKFYIPKEFINNNLETEFKESIQKIEDIRLFFREKGIRSELINMFYPQYRMVKFVMAAPVYDFDAWNNLFRVRGENTGTMNITQEIVNEIKKIINLENLT